MHAPLISPADLNARIGSVLPIDCRFDLARPNAGREAYAAGHIPGAIYAHLDEDLSSPITPHSGRHPLPHPAVLASTFGRWGIDSSTQVIAYDADTGMFASRLWWLLRWLGHLRVAVLDGGFKAWQAAGLPTSTSMPAPKPAVFVGQSRDDLVVSADEVAVLVKQNSWRVLDARAPERFRGDVEPIDPVAGHIPGARNHPFAANMGSDGRLLPAVELAAKLNASLDGVSAERSVMMCGSGVTACHNLLAMEVAGLRGAKLYAGSWSEWIRDPSRPVTRGAAQISC
jgi:thiosulfate/3-mercaptopyruvate sulfurtransferase